METVIKIKHLYKNYKMYSRKKDRLLEILLPNYQKHTEFSSINNFNLEINKGEVLGILGKNGAGKSTLLKMITGVVTPTSGEIEIDGKISSLLELGTAFNQELTGFENIYQHGQVMGLSNEEIKQKETEIIEFADIGQHLYHPVKTYSSGMFARLAFACAINVNPDILIVDEVLSVGDMAFQLKCFKKFEQFKDEGKTILFVTHSVADIIRNCNRAIIIAEGKKTFDGDVKTAVDKYKKVIVGLEEKSDEAAVRQEHNAGKDDWKSNFLLNPGITGYGNGAAKIIDYGIFDDDDNYQSVVNNNKEYIVKMKIKVNTNIEDPIFALAVKDLKGLELAGANTRANKLITGKYQQGDTLVVSFRQIFPLAPEKYTLSFGCTKINDKGNLEVYDRKYDVLFLEVISNKDCLGIIDLKTEIMIEKMQDGK
ncbi:MAG: ABC transporter ATP-binding protein [Lachnospiraceae bacterium]